MHRRGQMIQLAAVPIRWLTYSQLSEKAVSFQTWSRKGNVLAWFTTEKNLELTKQNPLNRVHCALLQHQGGPGAGGQDVLNQIRQVDG